MLYEWRGLEEELGFACTAQRFQIDIITDSDPQTKKAAGMMWICDYVEHGIVGDHKWEAVGKKVDAAAGHDVYHWEIKPVDAFWKHKDTGKEYFTLDPETNVAMERFIGAKLNRFLLSWSGEPLSTPLIEEPPHYTGQPLEYKGVCVCGHIKSSTAKAPFTVESIAPGEYPQNCFQCSCGRQWWQSDPSRNYWVPVGDPKLWRMILEYDGAAVRPAVIHPHKLTAYLLETVTQEGLIPIG